MLVEHHPLYRNQWFYFKLRYCYHLLAAMLAKIAYGLVFVPSFMKIGTLMFTVFVQGSFLRQ